MGKLIELLNEYEEKENLNMYEWEIEWEDILAYSKFRDGYETINVWESIIISKWYEFIKRLVENDKINKHSIPEFYPVSDHCLECVYEWIADNTIMLLSIQKNPIDYLISLLK